ncbi:MAG: hypothetical protein NC215_05410, partial [Ruminococcus sp.]|nr:hypothetical protein [Ruminococcus sp.]
VYGKRDGDTANNWYPVEEIVTPYSYYLYTTYPRVLSTHIKITDTSPVQYITSGTFTFTAVWEKTKINNIYAGGINAEVYVGAPEAEAVYKGSSKIYG